MKTGYPSSGDQIFEDLRYEGKFLEAFTYAWGMVESDIDQKIVYEFRLDTPNANLHPKTGDPKVRYILRQSFEGKIDFLREIKKANLNYKVLRDFWKKRNELFHGGNYSKRFLRLTEAEKKEYLDAASAALRTSMWG